MEENKNRLLPSEYLNSRPELVEGRITQLKSVLSVIPYVGSALNEILFELPNRIHQARINETVELLTKKMKFLEKSFVDKEYLKSPSFFDFTRKMFEESLKIESYEKRKVLSAIYIGALKHKEDFETGRSGLFMRFIGDLSIEQLKILKFIDENQSSLKEIGTYEKLYKLYLTYNQRWIKDRYDFKFYFSDLESKSLISMGSGLDDFMSKSDFFAFQAHEEASVAITHLGYTFIDFLKE